MSHQVDTHSMMASGVDKWYEAAINNTSMPDLTPDQIDEIQESLKAEVRRKEELIKAYDLVKQHLASSTQPSTSVALDAIRERQRSRVMILPAYGRITNIVRKGISNMRNPFTIRELYNYLVEDGEMGVTIDSVTTAMNRIREEEPPVVRVRAPGKGRRPTIFVKA